MIIHVKVIANSSQSEIVEIEDNTMKIKCRATPEKGKANRAIIEILAKHYRVPQSAIKILRGKTHAQKVIEVSEC